MEARLVQIMNWAKVSAKIDLVIPKKTKRIGKEIFIFILIFKKNEKIVQTKLKTSEIYSINIYSNIESHNFLYIQSSCEDIWILRYVVQAQKEHICTHESNS